MQGRDMNQLMPLGATGQTKLRPADSSRIRSLRNSDSMPVGRRPRHDAGDTHRTAIDETAAAIVGDQVFANELLRAVAQGRQRNRVSHR